MFCFNIDKRLSATLRFCFTRALVRNRLAVMTLAFAGASPATRTLTLLHLYSHQTAQATGARCPTILPPWAMDLRDHRRCPWSSSGVVLRSCENGFCSRCLSFRLFSLRSQPIDSPDLDGRPSAGVLPPKSTPGGKRPGPGGSAIAHGTAYPLFPRFG
jgi:hypothetical protein